MPACSPPLPSRARAAASEGQWAEAPAAAARLVRRIAGARCASGRLRPWLVAATLAAAPAAAQQSFAATAAQVAFAPRAGAQVPLDLQFTDDRGAATDLGRCCGGRPTVLALVYYRCPMLCNLEVEGLLRALALVTLQPGSDYSVVLVSIDPEETSADGARRRRLVQQQSRQLQGGAGWSFLTGSKQRVAALADSVGYRFVYDARSDEYAHAAGLLLLDGGGKVRRFLGGIDYPARALQLGLVESSDGSVGSVIDHLLLLCYCYDPSTGRYGLAIYTLLRVFGFLTVLGIVGGILLHLRRERRRRAASSG